MEHQHTRAVWCGGGVGGRKERWVLVYVTGERIESRRLVIEYDKISVWTRMVGEEFLSCFSESFSPSTDPPTTDTSAGGFRFSVLGSQVEFEGSSDVGEGGGVRAGKNM